MPVPLPVLAVQTCHAPGSGLHGPELWGPVLAHLHRRPDGEPIPTRTLLADPGLAGLPAAIGAWGRDRLAVGATCDLGGWVVVIARDPRGYARLCRFLSWRAETPDRWAAGADRDLTGLIALVRDVALGRRLESAGAEVRWRCHDTPDGDHAPWPALWLPLVSLMTRAERRGDPLRRGLTTDPAPATLALEELHDLAPAFADHPGLVFAGHELLSACGSGVPAPALHMPPADYEDAQATLTARAEAGLRRRYGDPLPEAVTRRLVHELGVIAAKGFAGYLLTVADLAAGRRTCGRGSGASSLVVYGLGITNVDPLRYGLLFERFLSPSRTDPPDLDVDFPWDERDAVFRAALARYGHEHVAMVATHQRLRPKGALRAVARAWGLPQAETSAVAGRLRAERRYGQPANLPAPWPSLVEDAATIEGLHLHDGLHCGGLVITPEPIRDLVPIHPAAKCLDEDGEEPFPVPAIAWEKDGAEAMGLVKIDILGNRSLAVIRDSVADLAALGQPVDEAAWAPEDDPATRDLVARGDTLGCFYIESPAMRQLQAQAGSGDLDRLVVHSSIIRPAANHWIQEYLHRLHHHRRTGRHEDHWYPHPALKSLCSESFGILSYQEDVMLVSQAVAGFTEIQANRLRKALGHWGAGGVVQFHGDFLAGAKAHGVRADVATTVWANIASFSGYSFAKAHSASYAKVSFQCAWLKAHAPAVFLARVIANEGGFYHPAAYVEEARRRGVGILGPSVLHSVWRTAPEGPAALRLGLHLVPQVSARRAETILRERTARPFAGLGDFLRRTGLTARVLRSLADVGALDDLRPDLHRDQVRWLVDTLVLAPRPRGVVDPPGTQWAVLPPEWQDPPVPDLPEPLAGAFDRYRALGICPEHHPIQFTTRPDPWRAQDLASLANPRLLAITGLVVTRKQVTAHHRGRPAPMAFVTLEDDTGLIETVWFPPSYRAYGALLDHGRPVRVHGLVERTWGVPSLQVQAAEALAWETPQRFSAHRPGPS